MKMMAGEFCLAMSNKSRTRLAPTPTNISTKSEPEIEKNGTAEEKDCADYVAHKDAGSDPPNITFQNGWRRDCDPFTGKVLESRQVDDPSAPGGKRGMRFADFMLHPIVLLCQLTAAEVFALRFYTTAGFKGINWQEFHKIQCSEFYVLNILGH